MANGITAAEIVEAIKGSKGLVTVVAKRLGYSRMHVYRLLDKYATAKEALEDERESMKDFTENKLFDMIDDKIPAAVFFYLKTQAKDRGYVEKQEFEHSGSVENKHIITPPKDE